MSYLSKMAVQDKLTQVFVRDSYTKINSDYYVIQVNICSNSNHQPDVIRYQQTGCSLCAFMHT